MKALLELSALFKKNKELTDLTNLQLNLEEQDYTSYNGWFDNIKMFKTQIEAAALVGSQVQIAKIAAHDRDTLLGILHRSSGWDSLEDEMPQNESLFHYIDIQDLFVANELKMTDELKNLEKQLASFEHLAAGEGEEAKIPNQGYPNRGDPSRIRNCIKHFETNLA